MNYVTGQVSTGSVGNPITSDAMDKTRCMVSYVASP
jgi:hypothetical protein